MLLCVGLLTASNGEARPASRPVAKPQVFEQRFCKLGTRVQLGVRTALSPLFAKSLRFGSAGPVLRRVQPASTVALGIRNLHGRNVGGVYGLFGNGRLSGRASCDFREHRLASD